MNISRDAGERHVDHCIIQHGEQHRQRDREHRKVAGGAVQTIMWRGCRNGH